MQGFYLNPIDVENTSKLTHIPISFLSPELDIDEDIICINCLTTELSDEGINLSEDNIIFSMNNEYENYLFALIPERYYDLTTKRVTFNLQTL